MAASVVAYTNSSFCTTPLLIEKMSQPYVPAFTRFLKTNGHYSLAVAAVYVVCIMALQRWMSSRPRYTLRPMLILWNLVMSVFATFGALRTVPFFINLLADKGVIHSICDAKFFTDPVTNLWPMAFVISRYPELLDTVFIVLRKQPLSFLHFFHHASVIVFASMSYPFYAGTGLWFMTMNYAVHSIMYSYYFFKAANIYVPRFISMIITFLQILQMIVACCVTGYSYFGRLAHGLPCGTDGLFNIYMAAALYFSYFVLFGHFFITAYFFSSPKKSASPKKSGSANGTASHGKSE